MIKSEISMNLSGKSEDVFAFLDDDSKTPLWLQRCVSLKKLSTGPKKVGTKLLYTYKEGGRERSMDGVVTTYEKNQRITTAYTDKMFNVNIHFSVQPAAEGTVLKHVIEITPRTFIGKLFSPLISLALPSQTKKDMAKLRDVLGH